MNDTGHHGFDLARFVVGFLEQQESIVTPPAYGVYEALLPDELAADLQLDPYQRLAFAAGQDEESLHLSYNHPLVEVIAGRLQQQPANACIYVNHVRLSKQGLADLAPQRYAFSNARLSAKEKSTQGRALHHYLRFNFKIALISDEKQEFLVSAVMDVQGGYAVRDVEILEGLALHEQTPAFDNLPIAPLQWRERSDPLSVETFDALLPRAKDAVLEEMAPTLSALHARNDRHLQLDRARIEGYYDDLERDQRRRLDRAAASDEQRRSNAEEKLSALHAEREMKLAHLAERYEVRVEMELINLLLLVQPKLRQPVTIGNRTVNITRTAVWDPLVHRMEALICDVCGQPGEDLHLCTGGHLAHSRCLADQCIDCSRVYCQRCSDQIDTCAVCHEPVCQRSKITCPTCGRGTCREHQNLCHAADGEPVDLATQTAEPEPEPPSVPEPAAPTPTTAERPARQDKPSKGRQQKPISTKKQRLVKAIRIQVDVSEDEPLIAAFVMRSAKRTWAVRTLRLTPDGINVQCDCEKGADCEHNGYFHRPAGVQLIGEQIAGMLKSLRSEYLTPAKKTTYFYGSHNRILRESQVLILPEVWLDEARLRAAQKGFDNLR